MNKLLCLSWMLLNCLFIVNKSFCQEKYYSQQLDNSSGLSNSCLNVIFQDSQNLMWFGTWDGLNMYDGSSFHVFNYNNGNGAKGIGNNVIYDIKEDKSKNIWIATIEGVSKYDKQTGEFKNFFYRKSIGNQVIDKGYLLAIDNNGEVYSIQKSESNLQHYNATSKSFQKYTFSDFNIGKILKMAFDDQNRLWLLNQKGELSVFKKKGQYFLKLNDINFTEQVSNFFFVNGTVLFTSNANKLFKFDQTSGVNSIINLPHPVRDISFFDDKYLFAWASKGLGEYDASFRPISNLSAQIKILSDVRITTLKMGDQNMLWIGTDGYGVIKTIKKGDYFGLVKKLPGGDDINIPIRAFNEVNNELWIGTKGDGIIQIKDMNTPQASYEVVRNFQSVGDLLDNCVYAIEKGKNDYVYVGSDAFGLTLYDKKTKKWYKWKDIANNKKYASFNSVHCILIDQDESIWLGSESYGLIHLKISRTSKDEPTIDYLKKYIYTGNNQGPVNNVIYTLANGSHNKLYVGCRYGGLNVFDKVKKEFRTIKAFSYSGSLSNNDVLSLYKDKNNRLWIGTSYGLNVINERKIAEKNPIFTHFTTENGLPNNTIHALNGDNEGYIWASTNKGLVKINPKSNNIIRFKEQDGLQSDEFSDNAVWKNKNGFLYFGGIYGFNYFLPSKINTTSYYPNIMLSEIQLAGKTVDAFDFKVLKPHGAEDIPDFEVKAGDDFFQLKIKALDFQNYEKCQYAYFLEGNDKTWHYLSDNNVISYNNISPGNYTLKLKWSNGGGLWTKEVSAFHIKFKQYFWLTWPAFLFYFTALVLSGIIFYRYRRDKFRMRYNLRTEHLLRERDEELHQGQLNFFTNIAHELQTPLTLILGALERYIYKSKLDTKSGNNLFLSIIGNQASRLTYLVYQLLEFRKATSGNLKINYSYLNISKLFINISNLFKHTQDHNKLDFSCEIEENIDLWMDKDKVEKIVFNLLSNAFKHTPQGEFIHFSVKALENKESFEISIANSGCYLDKEEVKCLFERFFVADENQQNKISTGIGLAFTRELIVLLGGSIDVTLQNEWITFKVILPLNYIPQNPEILSCDLDAEKPSHLLHSLVIEKGQQEEIVISNQNKNAVLNSLDGEQKKSILIIEDEPSIRFLLRDILKDTYLVYEANNGKKAIEIIKKIIPNLIISDIMMPDMNGLEVCNIIKNTPETCHIPFIILSAKGTIEHKMEGYEAGADAYLPKPFHSEHLLLRIRKLLEYQEKLYSLFSKHDSPIKLTDVGMKDSDKSFLENLMGLIENNLENENLDASLLEKELRMSKANFYRKLKSISGMTPSELIKSIRLQHAAAFLENSDLTVSEIFYKTGFSNQSHFFREFKKKYNCSPNEYRAKFKLAVV